MNENDKQAEPVAWRPILQHPIPWVTGKPQESDIRHWTSQDCEIEYAYTHPAQPVQPAGDQELRYTADRALAECPCCGSLDVGGVHDTVNCYGCGLTVTAPRPLQNAINKWNQRTNKAPAPAGAQELAGAANKVYELCLSGKFYEDHDGSTAALGELRAALIKAKERGL